MKNTLLHVVPQMIVLCFLLRSVKVGWVNGVAIGLCRPERPVWPYLAIYVAYTLGIEAFNYWRGAVETSHWNLGPLEIALRVLGIIVLAPILEEWIFRGVLLEVLGRRLSFLISNVLQGTAFVLLHVPDLTAGSSPVVDGAQVMVDALFFGWVRHRTRSLYPGMVAHALGNSLAVFERLL